MGPEAFAACESPIKGKGPHPSRKEYKRLISQVFGTNGGTTGKFMTSREYRNEPFSQDRFHRQPILRFAVAKKT